MNKVIQNTKIHKPVMVDEVIKNLNLQVPLKNQAKIIDATLGLGGHARKIASKKTLVLGIETDREFVLKAKEGLKDLSNVQVIWGNFRNLKEIARNEGFDSVNGILFDLGVNTLQLTSNVRGFSFNEPKARLDMRLDRKNQKVNASDLLNSLRRDQLFELFEPYLEYKGAKSLSYKVVEKRNLKPFFNVEDFLSLFPEKKSGKVHPATKSFMALRIAVNMELDSLREALNQSFELMKKKARLVIITFHSGEDRIVKNFFKHQVELGEGKLITKKPILPKTKEIEKNKSARSAKLRTIEKI